MKNKIKSFTYGGIALAAIAFTNSCQRDLTSLNEDPKHASVLPSGNLLATGQYQEFYYMYTGSVNFNNYRFFTQYWAETVYVQEQNYNLVTRAQPRNHFNRMYVYALNSFNQAKLNLLNETNTDSDVLNNKKAILELSSIFVWENIVDTYGNVPYSQALQVADITTPAYDDAHTIYLDLLNRIDAAIAMINPSKEGYTEDLVYGGDMSKWIKMANSLKLRLAINLADVDAVTAKAAAESAIEGGLMDSQDDSYSLIFDGGTFTNPIYDDLVASKRNDFVPSNVIVDPMNANSDPRRSVYFTPVNGIFKGGVYGTLNVYSQYSHVANSYKDPAAPANLLGYTEVLFLKAEAAARDFNVGDTASNLYEEAVAESFAENGLGNDVSEDYIAAHPFDAANWKQSIGYESWIALWNSPFASWNFVRRLDYPILNTPPQSYIGGVPYRMPYSDQEYVVNQANVTAAANAIGGDKATTKLFWDIF